MRGIINLNYHRNKLSFNLTTLFSLRAGPALAGSTHSLIHPLIRIAQQALHVVTYERVSRA